MNPQFSIITPSYNQGRFLRDCIESVAAQKGMEFEHIIVDAGSTDETVTVLKSYPHLKWRSEPDQGMSDGINKGFRLATGEWLMWLNCDDFLLPDALEKVASFIRMSPLVDIVHGDCVFVDEAKNPIRRKRDHPVDERVLLYAGCFIPSTSTFLRRKVINDGHLLDMSYKVCMDWEYYLRLLRLGYRYGYLSEALAGFRWHGTNTSLVHLERGNAEALRLQAEHIRERGWCNILAWQPVLRVMRRLYQAKRVAMRVRCHHRFS